MGHGRADFCIGARNHSHGLVASVGHLVVCILAGVGYDCPCCLLCVGDSLSGVLCDALARVRVLQTVNGIRLRFGVVFVDR